MKFLVKKGHPHGGHPAPTTSTGQPGGKRTQDYGYATGNSGGTPTPTPSKHPAISKVLPDDAHVHGQPHPDDPVFRKVGKMGQGKQPGKPAMDLHPKTGKAGEQVSVVTTAAKPKTVKHMLRQKTGSSHSARMRAEGQHMHEHGPLHGHDGKVEKPFTNRGRHLKQPGRPHIAAGARIDDHMPDREMKNQPGEQKGWAGDIRPHRDMIQPRIAKYGSAARFMKLMMTRKRDKGGAA